MTGGCLSAPVSSHPTLTRMPDLFLDTRPPDRRSSCDVASLLRWVPELRVRVWDLREFRLVITWSEPDELWEPLQAPGGTICAVAGFVALDEEEWSRTEQATTGAERGGLAARAILARYQERGTAGWDDVSGNGCWIVYDAAKALLHIRTDPAGCLPLFCHLAEGHPVWSSHPDVLAGAVDRGHRLDEVSLAEFIQTSTVTPPWTYYEGIEACESGCVFTMDLRTGRLTSRSYFALEFTGGAQPDPETLAAELARAWRRAVRRRTLPRLGRVAVALSGGLDSRLILAAMEDPSRALAFTCYDAPNRELKTARAIAAAVGAEFQPFARPPDYYGENAPAGVRLSGGMGTFANNHFLGVWNPLRTAGTRLLLTGCYCDYLFKGLPLNRRIRAWDGRESLAPYRHEFYFQHWHFDTPLARKVWDRWEARFPAPLRQRMDDEALHRIETLRTFPLYHEGDNQQRIVPQRLGAWSPPVTDLEMLRLYRRVPSRFKLNRDLFLRAARLLLAGSSLIKIPDANTGAPLTAPAWLEAASWQWLRLKRKMMRLRRSPASDGSWPDWSHYYRHSPALELHWRTAGTELHDRLLAITGWKALPARPADFPPDQCFLFVPLLTLKLWWQHRACSAAPSN